MQLAHGLLDDLADSEIRRRLVQRGYAPWQANQMVRNRETIEGRKLLKRALKL